MEWQGLKRKAEAPKKGWVLAYTRKKVIFHPYETWEALEPELADVELLELHLFDQEKEYRCLSTRSKRFPEGVIETVADFREQDLDRQDDNTEVYAEHIRLLWGGAEITVLNHVSYDKTNGMAIIDNYRLRM